MKILLSPAKKLYKPEAVTASAKMSQPLFKKQTGIISGYLKMLSISDLKKLMNISDALAMENSVRNQILDSSKNISSSAAAFTFAGETYRGLDIKALDSPALNYLQENLYILSGLYGLLRPLDAIQPYRLEMGTALAMGEKKNLYDFWGDMLTKWINKEMKPGEILLNLASQEYSKVLDKKLLKATMIDVDFMDFRNGELKKIMVYFKQARGAMARYCAEKNIQTIEEVKSIHINNYRLDASLSTPTLLVFTR